MQDFNYLATNAFEITLELGCQKYTPEKELEKEWIRNKDALLAFIWKAHTGVKGIVSDDSGFIQNAIISVVNITGPVPRPIRHDITTGTFDNIRFFLLLSLYFISYLSLNRFLTMGCKARLVVKEDYELVKTSFTRTVLNLFFKYDVPTTL